MSFCTNCGHELPPALEAEVEIDTAEVHATAEVEVERIRAEKEVAIAKINAGLMKDELVVENAALAAANEVLEEVAAPEPAPLEDTQPIVIEAPEQVNDEPEFENAMPPGDDDAPHHSSHKRVGLGVW